MTKKQRVVSKPVATKRQLSRWQRQRLRQRIMFSVGMSIIGCIAVILGYGYYDTEFKPLHQTVIQVNEVDFDMSYYLKVLRLYSNVSDPSMLSGLAAQLVINIQNNELIRQGASTLGIKVAPEEIDERLKDRDLPLERAYRDMVEVELLLDRLREGYLGSKVPEFAPQARVQAMLLVKEDEAEEVIDRLAAGDDFADIAGELSQDPASKANNGDLGWLPEGYMSPQFDEAAFSLEPDVLSEPIYDETAGVEGGYWLVKVLERDNDREVDSDMREVLKGKAIDDWVLEQREKSKLENYLDEEKRAWVIGRVLRSA